MLLLTLGATAHTLIPYELTVPSNVAALPPPTAVAEARIEPRILIDQTTVFARMVETFQVPAYRVAGRTTVPNVQTAAVAAILAALPAWTRVEVPPVPAPPAVAAASSSEKPRGFDAPVVISLEPVSAGLLGTAESVDVSIPPVQQPDAVTPDARVATPLRAMAPLPAAVRPANANPGSSARLSDEALVRRLLDEYAGAFERLDVVATKAVWPSVNDKALKRAYEQLAGQSLSLQSCGITIDGSTANARCRGSATYLPKIGRPVQIAAREWMFDLSKTDAAWRIVNTLVR